MVPWLMWLSWLERCPITEGLQVQFPVRAHAKVVSSLPDLGCTRDNRLIFLSCIDASVLPSSLSRSNEKIKIGHGNWYLGIYV